MFSIAFTEFDSYDNFHNKVKNDSSTIISELSKFSLMLSIPEHFCIKCQKMFKIDSLIKRFCYFIQQVYLHMYVLVLCICIFFYNKTYLAMQT